MLLKRHHAKTVTSLLRNVELILLLFVMDQTTFENTLVCCYNCCFVLDLKIKIETTNDQFH